MSAYRCPKCRKRMKFVSAGLVVRDGDNVAATKQRCPRCGTEATIVEGR